MPKMEDFILHYDAEEFNELFEKLVVTGNTTTGLDPAMDTSTGMLNDEVYIPVIIKDFKDAFKDAVGDWEQEEEVSTLKEAVSKNLDIKPRKFPEGTI